MNSDINAIIKEVRATSYTKWAKIKQKEATPQTAIKSASDRNDEPRNIKEDMWIENEVMEAANVLEKCKVMVASSNITDNTKFCI